MRLGRKKGSKNKVVSVPDLDGICFHCKKSFKYKACQKKYRSDGRIFCSRSCCSKTNNSKEKHPNWKGGITPANAQIRHSEQYKKWRNFVFYRDEYKCVRCSKHCGKDINAHHLKQFSTHPELRFYTSNGVTLCTKCHKIVHQKMREYRKNAMV